MEAIEKEALKLARNLAAWSRKYPEVKIQKLDNQGVKEMVDELCALEKIALEIDEKC